MKGKFGRMSIQDSSEFLVDLEECSHDTLPSAFSPFRVRFRSGIPLLLLTRWISPLRPINLKLQEVLGFSFSNLAETHSAENQRNRLWVMWVWVKIIAPGNGPQVLVLVSFARATRFGVTLFLTTTPMGTWPWFLERLSVASGERQGELSQEEFVDGLLQMVVRDVPMETMRSLTEQKKRAKAPTGGHNFMNHWFLFR